MLQRHWQQHENAPSQGIGVGGHACCNLLKTVVWAISGRVSVVVECVRAKYDHDSSGVSKMTSLARYYVRKALRRSHSFIQELRVGAKSSFMFGLQPEEKVALFEFKTYEDIDRFQIHTDRVMGGMSVNARLASLADNPKNDFDLSATFQDLRSARSVSSSTTILALVAFKEFYEATLDKGTVFVASGLKYASGERLKNLHAYSALEMRIRSDGRRYQVYVSDLPDEQHTTDIFRAEFQTPADEWTTIACPFDEFVTIRKNMVTPSQRSLDRECLHGFGISIADDEEGPFYVELQYVKVIRNYDPSLYSTTDRLLEGPSKKIDRIPR